MIYSDVIFRWGQFQAFDVLQAWLQIQLQEIAYYWLHRAQHHYPAFYYYHKTHHTVKTPRALSFSVHGVVDTWFNFVWTFAGPLLMWYYWPLGKIHAFANIGVWTWNLCAGAETHSGFWYAPLTDLTFLPIDLALGRPGFDHSPAHYFHHTVNTGAYGHWMDTIFGTDKTYMKWRKQKGCTDKSYMSEVLKFT